VADSKIAIVGTANMDFRSFDLNFEVNAIVYDAGIATELRSIFFDDLNDAEKINPGLWYNRSRMKQLWQKTARLVSPLL
jgi:cardiolipin synthase